MHSLHPIGLFFSAISPNIKQYPVESPQLRFQMGSGNVWLPPVTGYIPTNVSDRERVGNIPWHERENAFNVSEIPSEQIQFQADGVIKSLIFSITFPVSKNLDYTLKSKSYLLTKGQFPLSWLTSDTFIEWVHSSIVNDEDPFARKYYGINKAGINYSDESGSSLEWKNGVFLLPGMESHLFYYLPSDFFDKLGLTINLGIHGGFNFSKFNRSLDLGLSANVIQKINETHQRKINLGGSYILMKPGIATFGNYVNLSNVEFFHELNGQFTYQFSLKRDRYFQLGINYSYKSSFRKKREFEYVILTGERISTHWHYALSHLYKPIHSGSLVITISKKNSVSAYLRQDLISNNAPDLQIGLDWLIRM